MCIQTRRGLGRSQTAPTGESRAAETFFKNLWGSNRFCGTPLIQRAAKSNPINRRFRSASAVWKQPTTTKQLEANQNQAPPVVRVGHPVSRMKGFGGTNRKAIHTMKAKTKRCLELLDRVSRFFSEHPTLTFGTRGAALVGQIEPRLTASALMAEDKSAASVSSRAALPTDGN